MELPANVQRIFNWCRKSQTAVSYCAHSGTLRLGPPRHKKVEFRSVDEALEWIGQFCAKRKLVLP